MAEQDYIRNFSIIAHIDHGKSTLADRILEMTDTVTPREMRAQVLDSMDLERERGITIKAAAVRVKYTARDGIEYQLHLIDTPGHVDFTYEVSRSLAACEGALLVVDASQGVEAQTVANTYLAVDAGLELIPCLNKIDLPGAEPERVAAEVAELIGEDPDSILRISGKTGDGVVDVLERLVATVPAPSGNATAPPRALIFDSEFDQYRGLCIAGSVYDTIHIDLAYEALGQQWVKNIRHPVRAYRVRPQSPGSGHPPQWHGAASGRLGAAAGHLGSGGPPHGERRGGGLAGGLASGARAGHGTGTSGRNGWAARPCTGGAGAGQIPPGSVALCQHQSEPGGGILCRWHDRGADFPSVKAARAAGHCPHVGDAIQRDRQEHC